MVGAALTIISDFRAVPMRVSCAYLPGGRSGERVPRDAAAWRVRRRGSVWGCRGAGPPLGRGAGCVSASWAGASQFVVKGGWGGGGAGGEEGKEEEEGERECNIARVYPGPLSKTDQC